MKLLKISFFAILSIFLCNKALAAPDSLMIDKMMDFKVQTIDGDEVNFKSFLGKGPVLVGFWALWCEPCKQEMKAFHQLVDKYKARGISMVSINTDKVRSQAKVRSYIKSQGYEFPVLLDADGTIATEKFSMESLPYSLILNTDGTIAKRHIGFTAGDEVTVEKEINEILAPNK
jgi:peroxiredoxin